jgi:glutamate/tyrosine decarboxylase-like PLP-dependent enzyme
MAKGGHDVDELLLDAAGRASRYLADLQERPVAPSGEALDGLKRLDETLPRQSIDPRDTLALLDEAGSPATLATAGPRFFGFVIGGSLPVTVAANWLAGAWDQPAGLVAASPIAAALESVARRWLVELLGLPARSDVAFVTGATVANFVALAAARHDVLQRLGWDVESDGLFGAPPITVAVGAEAHPSLLKALGMLGLGRNRVVRVPVDGQGRMRADLIPRLEPPAILCAQAGNVNTGAVDPLAEIAARGHELGAWTHVDGAFGLWAAAAPSLAALVVGLADADSWATDAHKWLNVPYDSGLAFVREPGILPAAMSVSAAYLPTDGEREPSFYTPELSRRARGVEVWAALRTLGASGVAELIERCCRHARLMAQGLQAAGYEVLNDVVLNQALVSFGDEEATRRVVAAVQREGTCWAGGTVWQGRTAMRVSFSSWATTDGDVERSLRAVIDVAGKAR